ncbi:MAG: hypothetical protein HW377_2437, partial [Actinobacteria bacterium]|nr:hypothetical protein [Actinomycetota bacterium]
MEISIPNCKMARRRSQVRNRFRVRQLEYLFGPDTNYHKAERILDFSKTATGYSGHIIQLIRQVSGNLPTTQIGPRD